jgi:hypothetical protein
MTSMTRRWFRSLLLLMMMAVSAAQVPACEYGQQQSPDGNTQPYRVGLADPPQPSATPCV